MDDSPIGQRKADHLSLASSGDVGYQRTTTLLDDVRLLHDALPDLDAGAIDTRVELFGKTLKAPLLIAAMTGGVDEAGVINRELSALAESRGYGFGLGSQRAMHMDPRAVASYRVRDVANSTLVLGNLGLMQARDMPSDVVAALVSAVGADAICIHLNPAMEMVQPGGDRDFTHGCETLARLVRDLSVPVVVKETGCGLSLAVGKRLRGVGVAHVDVSGAGGTSWVAVEMHRAEGPGRALAETFREWGIPTAASVAWMHGLGFRTVIATGGIATGLDVARAIALGADAAGLARPVLRAFMSGGRAAAEALLDGVEAELRTAMLLCGARSIADLKSAPRVVVGELRAWLGPPSRGPDS